MITFGQTSMNRDGWTTGVPLNTELVAGCSHGTMLAHMCGLSGHTPGTHTLLSLPTGNLLHTLSLFYFSHRYNFTSSFSLTVLSPKATHNYRHVSCPHTPACFENVHERRRGGGERKKKKKKSSSNSKSQRGHRNNTQSQSCSHGDKCGSVQ